MKVKTDVAELRYISIKGEGRNQAMKGEPPRMQYTASIILPGDSKALADLQEQINEEWKRYKAANGVKGQPSTNGIKPEYIKSPDGEIDPETEEVKKIPTGNFIATFKTNTVFPDGAPQIVRLKDRKGGDITEAYKNVPWLIGDGSIGRIFGTAMANNIGGKHKVSLYLNGIQIAKLVKYEGSDIDADEIEGNFEGGDDFDDFTTAVEESPDL